MLCPPHLVDQWVTELQERFHISAAAVHRHGRQRGATSSADLPPSASIFYGRTRHTVVSLDYIKTRDRRRDGVPSVPVPSSSLWTRAHTCASAIGQGRHQRYELLKGLAGSRRLVTSLC